MTYIYALIACGMFARMAAKVGPRSIGILVAALCAILWPFILATMLADEMTKDLK